MARDLSDRALLSLRDFARVEPPAWLDELVQQRVGARLEQQRCELAEQSAAQVQPLAAFAKRGVEPSMADSTGVRAVNIGAGGLGRAEAWAYAFGFLAYGAQVADGLARLIWHALSG